MPRASSVSACTMLYWRCRRSAASAPASRSRTNRFSTSHTPSRSGPAPPFICAITDASWAILRSRSAGVQPMMSAPIARATFSVRRGEFSSSKRFSRFHQAT